MSDPEIYLIDFEEQKKFEFASTTKSFQNSHFQKDFMVSNFLEGSSLFFETFENDIFVS